MRLSLLEHPYRETTATTTFSRNDLAHTLTDTSLDWTGEGVRRDHLGELFHVRHAMEHEPTFTTGLDARSIVTREVSKLLVLEQLRPLGFAELQRWFIECFRANTGTRRSTLTQVLAEVRRGILLGECWSIAYEPRGGRTTISWPWGGRVHIYDREFMRSVWFTVFGADSQPELGRRLLGV